MQYGYLILKLQRSMRLHPVTGEAFGLGDLVTTHSHLDYVFALLRRDVSLGSGKIEPHVGENVVFRHPITFVIHDSKEPLTFRMSLLGG